MEPALNVKSLISSWVSQMNKFIIIIIKIDKTGHCRMGGFPVKQCRLQDHSCQTNCFLLYIHNHGAFTFIKNAVVFCL